MHEIKNLKEKLCRELEEYSSKGRLDEETLRIIDTIAHTIKNLNKIIEQAEMSEYSEGPHFRGTYSMANNNNYSNGYNYANNNNSNGYSNNWRMMPDFNGSYSGANRYSMSNSVIMDKLQQLLNDAPDEKTRREIQKFMNHMEQI